MENEKVVDSLITLYGQNALDLAVTHINELKESSNIIFDEKYVSLGVVFLRMKCDQILMGDKDGESLKVLISESFGEAAIAIYNVPGNL